MPVQPKVASDLSVAIERPAAMNEQVGDRRKRLAIGTWLDDLTRIVRVDGARGDRDQRQRREGRDASEHRHGAPPLSDA